MSKPARLQADLVFVIYYEPVKGDRHGNLLEVHDNLLQSANRLVSVFTLFR